MYRNYFRRNHAVLVLSAMFACLGGQVGHAFDQLLFEVPGAGKSLIAELKSASALVLAEREKNTDPQDLFADARAEYGRLLGALYARGHYSAVIHVTIDGREAASIAPLDAPAAIGVIRVVVEPGPVFAFSQASVAPLAPDTELPDGFRTGQPAESGQVQGAVTAGIAGWREVGHAKAAVASQDVVADHARAQLAANVAIAPGPKLRFGPLSVEGEARMREARIRKIAGLPSGEVFSARELDRATQRLRRTGVFSSVSLTEDAAITAPDLLGITATVVEAKRRRYSFGAEVATFDGLKLSGSWLHRNLLGGGERLLIAGEITNIGIQAGGVDYALDISLERPATPGPDTTAGIAVGFSHLDEDDYQADLASVGVTFTHVFSENLTARAGVGYEWTQGKDISGEFIYRSLTLPLGATWDKRNVKTDATRGFYLEGEVKPFIGFGITESGARLALDARAYRGFGTDNRFVLAGRLQVGAVLGASLLGTPRDDLFYSGGGGTVRGQPYQSLGVEVDTVELGGAYFLGGSVEARVKVTPKIGVVGFFDMGQIGIDGFGGAGSEMHSGAGLGVRYATGFGPIRLDVGAPVSGETGDGVQIYVGLGQAF